MSLGRDFHSTEIVLLTITELSPHSFLLPPGFPSAAWNLLCDHVCLFKTYALVKSIDIQPLTRNLTSPLLETIISCKEHGLYTREMWVSPGSAAFTDSVTLSEVLNLSEPWLASTQKWDKIIYLSRSLGGLNKITSVRASSTYYVLSNH